MKQFLLVIALIMATVTCQAQDFTKIDKSVMDAAYYPPNAPKRFFAKKEADKIAAEPKIRVLYSRPLKKGREIFGKLLKYGKPWRLGANESTEILFLQDVKFGGQAIKAGRYSLIAIPEKGKMTLKINRVNDGWGNYSYDPEKDIASKTVKTSTSDEVIEALSIALYEKSPGVVHLKIGWDHTIAEFPIEL